MGEMTATSEGSRDTSRFSPKIKWSKLFTVLLWTVLSIAMIIVGSMHVDNCPVEPKIPIYLIVAGVFHLLAFLLIPLKMVAEKVAYSIESVLGLFSFCWFIAGSVWVFRIYQDNPRRCNDLVYKVAFGILIFEYIFLALVVAVVCLLTCCAGLLATSDIETPSRIRSPEDEEALK
ncbi:transmembrane protein 272-like [Hyla sarda]|uniref:transmembrane protein 272-like n=1 Tax=Hyla sarda TaxID=327740 RepID=UPI0024C39F8B|nr:transmembrane protein 272-like [Hyla sarda]